MKYCTSCGNPLNDGVGRCGHCGAVVAQPAPAPAAQDGNLHAEKACLDNYYRFLKYERLAWKISGFVLLGLCILLVLLSGLLLLIAMGETIDNYHYDTEVVSSTLSLAIVYFLYGILFLPIPIVCLKAASRVTYYMDTLYSDVRPTMERCGSVGMIIFCYLFNNIAFIFFLINFIRTQSEKNTLQNIIARQQQHRQL